MSTLWAMSTVGVVTTTTMADESSLLNHVVRSANLNTQKVAGFGLGMVMSDAI